MWGPNIRVHLIFLICLLLEVVVNFTAGTTERNAHTTEVGTTDGGRSWGFNRNFKFELGSGDPSNRFYLPPGAELYFGRKRRSPQKDPAPAPAPEPIPISYLPSWLPSLPSLPIPNIELPSIKLPDIDLPSIVALGGLFGGWGGNGGGNGHRYNYTDYCDYYDENCNYDSGWWGKRRKRSVSGLSPPENRLQPRPKRHTQTIINVTRDIITNLIQMMKEILNNVCEAFCKSKDEVGLFVSATFKSLAHHVFGDHQGISSHTHYEETENLRGKRKAMMVIRRKKRSVIGNLLHTITENLVALQENIQHVVYEAYAKSIEVTVGTANNVKSVVYDYWTGRSGVPDDVDPNSPEPET